MVGMSNNAPVSLYDGNGGFNTYIQDNVIPALLDTIEKSGLSYEDAKKVPMALSLAIDESIMAMSTGTRFKANSLRVP